MKNKIFLYAIIAVVVLFCVAVPASAMTEVERQALIAQIQQQLAELTAQLNQKLAEQNWCHTFNNNLGFNQSGTVEVGYLHTALTKQNISYAPDTGNTYSTGTESAVKIFQERYASEILAPLGLSVGSGYVAGYTRAKLNQLYGCSTTLPPTTCTPSWQTGSWSTCTNNQQTRTVTDLNYCGITTSKPAVTQSCTSGTIDPTDNPTTNPGEPGIPLIITYPIEGGLLPIGSRATIRWTSNSNFLSTSHISHIKLVGYEGPGYGKEFSITENTANDGEETITVPVVAPGKYEIEILVVTRSGGLDYNYFVMSKKFTISSGGPLLTITSPSAGDVWRFSDLRWTIRWATNNFPTPSDMGAYSIQAYLKNQTTGREDLFQQNLVNDGVETIPSLGLPGLYRLEMRGFVDEGVYYGFSVLSDQFTIIYD